MLRALTNFDSLRALHILSIHVASTCVRPRGSGRLLDSSRTNCPVRRAIFMMRTRKTVLFGVMMLMMILVVLEGLSFVTGKFLQSKWSMWRAPTGVSLFLTRAGVPITYSEYLKRRDPVLGWPYPDQYGQDLDVNGAQRNPYFPN